jgi:hypothetical protein
VVIPKVKKKKKKKRKKNKLCPTQQDDIFGLIIFRPCFNQVGITENKLIRNKLPLLMILGDKEQRGLQGILLGTGAGVCKKGTRRNCTTVRYWTAGSGKLDPLAFQQHFW